MKQNPFTYFAQIKKEHLEEIFSFKTDPKDNAKIVCLILGVILTPITLAGILIGYVRGYRSFMLPQERRPDFQNVPPQVVLSMVVWAFLIWLLLIVSVLFVILVFEPIYKGSSPFVLGLYILLNIILSFLIYQHFQRWQRRVDALLTEKQRFGSARFARAEELNAYRQTSGLYLGDGLTFADKGHVLLCGGTRSGKGVNIIIPNLLGKGDYNGSWCVIDPKGENAAITARYQREQGKDVVILNPWGLLDDKIGAASSYNPLDIIVSGQEINWIDDIQMIAEMLVPVTKDDKNAFFTDNARAMIAGILLHIVTKYKNDSDKEERTLAKLWEMLRYNKDDWDGLLADMATNFDPHNGNIVRVSSNEIRKLMEAGDETYGSILSTALQSTDFLKSPALKKALQSSFNPTRLSNGKTVLYIVIPVDKLQSHARWLRLVTTSLLRAVVRTPKEKVCFLLDEFISLGYLPEIEKVALATFAGFNLTLFMVVQSLNQLKGLYGDGWETFVGNSTIRLFTGINDNFTAEYISKAAGSTSHISIKQGEFQTTARPLITPDEVRRGSGPFLFAFLGGLPVTYFDKRPYYRMGDLGNRAEKNPYIKGE